MSSQNKRSEQRPWTEKEDEAIRQHYDKDGSLYLVRLLGRPRKRVQTRARMLGVWGGAPRWNASEEEYLRENYADTARAELASELGRSVQSVNHKLRKMGLTERVSRPWEDEEIAFLKDHYATMTCEEIADELLDRTHEAVSLKAQRIGLSHTIRIIDETERAWIIKNLGKISYLNMSLRLGVGISQVQNLAKEVGHRPRGVTRIWTKADDQYLRDNYRSMKAREISAAIDRTIPAIRTRAGFLKLTKPHAIPARLWTRKEEAILRTHWRKKKEPEEIARILKRSVFSVIGKADNMGLKRGGSRE